jgi:Holliday junction DNA helicase RuvA
MIASLTGQLARVLEDRAVLRAGPIEYELLVPAADLTTLQTAIGSELTFHTLFFMQGDGNFFEPTLIGFRERRDKQFFEKFITVKGIGPRTALRALTATTGEIAGAVEAKNAKFLTGLKGIGKRTAELIVAELAGKVAEFATPFADTGAEHGHGGGRRGPVEEDAISALMALGERRPDAEHLLERAKQGNPKLNTTDGFVREMLRMRTVRT